MNCPKIYRYAMQRLKVAPLLIQCHQYGSDWWLKKHHVELASYLVFRFRFKMQGFETE